MKDQKVVRTTLSLEEFFLGIMRYSQVCHGVSDFPRFPSRAWSRYIYFATQELHFPEPLNIEFGWIGFRPVMDETSCHEIKRGLEFTAIIDRVSHRMRLDTEESVWGRELGDFFPELAEEAYILASQMDNFIIPG